MLHIIWEIYFLILNGLAGIGSMCIYHTLRKKRAIDDLQSLWQAVKSDFKGGRQSGWKR